MGAPPAAPTEPTPDGSGANATDEPLVDEVDGLADGVELTGPDNDGWSYTRIHDWIILCTAINDVAFRVYAVIRSMIIDNTKGRSRRGERIKQLTYAELAYLLDVSESTVKRAVKSLEKAGLVTNPDDEVRVRQVFNPDTKRYEVRKWRRFLVNDLPPADYDGWHNAFEKLDHYRDLTGGGPGERGRAVQSHLTSRPDQRGRARHGSDDREATSDVSAGRTEGSDVNTVGSDLDQPRANLTRRRANLRAGTPSDQRGRAPKKPPEQAPVEEAPVEERPALRAAPPPAGDGTEEIRTFPSLPTQGDQLVGDLQSARAKLGERLRLSPSGPEIGELAGMLARTHHLTQPAAHMRAYRQIIRRTDPEQAQAMVELLRTTGHGLGDVDEMELARRVLVEATLREARQELPGQTDTQAPASTGGRHRRQFTRPSQSTAAGA